MATLDATTQAEYAAEVNAADRAQAVVDALVYPVYAKVYTSEDVVAASGTMTSPWATASGPTITVATLDGFFVTGSDTPNDGWYLRFESGSRYVDLSFGLSGSAKEAVWSLPTWDVGTQAGIIAGEITATGNRPPEWSSAPSTLSFTQGVGGTTDFSAYVSDPDEDTLTYSLIGTSYTGISIGVNSGVLTVSSAAVSAVRNLTVRATDPNGLYADHSVAVTIADASALKWHPGHYAAPDAVLFPTSLSAHTTLWNQIGPVANFVGGEMYVPWGQLEPTTAGNYTWSVLDGQIAALAALGKKAIISVWAHKYGTTSTGGGYFPQYLIDSGDVIVFDDGAGTRVAEACMWRSYVADRYMALFAALAARYDNDDRVAGLNTCETAFVNPGLDYSGSALLTQWQRIAAYLPTVLVRTPVFIKANFLQTQDHMATLMQSCVNAGAGMGGPDIFPIEYSGTTDNWGQRCLRGERYVSGAWVTGVAANQQSIIPVLMEQQVIRSTIATPAMFYNAAVTRYSCTHVTWQAKAAAKLYGGTTLIPAMNWLTGVLPYVRDNNLPLRTTIPTALA